MSMIDYANELNPAQYEAVMTSNGPVLVIAGAGSGKTRTIVYRLVRLVESGVPAASILLLTFTRKAAQEMLQRAGILLHQHDSNGFAQLSAVMGGTFHAFAYSILRIFRPMGYETNAIVMDHADMLAALSQCKDDLGIKGDRSFPRIQTIQGMLSKVRNKESSLEDVLRREAYHLLPHAESMEKMQHAYATLKRTQGVLDYDDLLFELEILLQERPEAFAYCKERYGTIMVDEYQDTNLVQSRLIRLLASGTKNNNVMAVGDDAQSIYAFRGATVRNILQFPELFPGTKLIRLEENYRSTQPVLDLTNALLEKASEGYKKQLFTHREGGVLPRVIRPMSDISQASIVSSLIQELLDSLPASEIAVLFRSGFHSYHLEMQLNKLGIAFQKFGGIRYTEAAHIKDVMAFARLVLNPLDQSAFTRIALQCKGVGAKTCQKIYDAVRTGTQKALETQRKRFPQIAADLDFLDDLRTTHDAPSELLSKIMGYYQPRLEEQFPDDHPRRWQGLEQLAQIAASYTELDMLVADLSLADPFQEQEEHKGITLSTIHSAKGLEWDAVLILDLVEGRFPSRHSSTREDDFEEERRLMYVACTRARERLLLSVPNNIYIRGANITEAAVPSPFIREVPTRLYEEWQEQYGGMLQRKDTLDSFTVAPAPRSPQYTRRKEQSVLHSTALDVASASSAMQNSAACGYCTHRIFGRGKIVQHLPPDKYRVNFPGFGLKVIMADYLVLEDDHGITQ